MNREPAQRERERRLLEEPPFGEVAPVPEGNAIPTLDDEYYRRVTAVRRDRNTMLTVIALIALLVVILAGIVSTRLPFGPFGGMTAVADKTIPGTILDLSTTGAGVTIHSWNGQGIRVRALERGGTSGGIAVDVASISGGVRVRERETSCGLFCWRDLRYDVSVPRAADLHVSTASGDVDLHSVGGTLRIGTASGDISLEGGSATETHVTTASGDVDLTGLSRRVAVQTASGDISIDGARDGALALQSISGDIDYTGSLANGGTNTVRSTSGDVTLHLPANPPVRVRTSTVSGDVSNSFPSNAAIGGGAATLNASTTSGDIDIGKQ